MNSENTVALSELVAAKSESVRRHKFVTIKIPKIASLQRIVAEKVPIASLPEKLPKYRSVDDEWEL